MKDFQFENSDADFHIPAFGLEDIAPELSRRNYISVHRANQILREELTKAPTLWKTNIDFGNDSIDCWVEEKIGDISAHAKLVWKEDL